MRLSAPAALALALATGTPAVSALPAAPPITPDVEFIAVDAIAAPGEDTRAEILISHPGTGGRYEVTVRAEASVPVGRPAPSLWLAGSSSATTVLYSEEVELSGGDTRLSLDLATGDQPWGFSMETWGPRGLEVEVSPVGEEGGATDRTILVTAPSFEVTPMEFTAVVPLAVTTDTLREVTAPGQRYEILAGGSAGEDTDAGYVTIGAALRESAGRVARTVEGLDVDGITLALDSAYASTELGTADLLADALGTFVAPGRRELLLLPYLDADTTAWADLGHDDLFAPALERMSEAQDSLTRLGIPARDNVYLPVTAATNDLLDAAWATGFRSALVTDEDYPLANPSYWSPAAGTTIDGRSLLVADTAMSAILTDPALSDLDRRQLLLAESAIHVRERPNDPRPFVLTVPREGASLEEAADLVGTLGEAPWLRPSTVSAIEAGPDHGLERLAPPSVPDRTGQLSSSDLAGLAQARDQLSTIAQITFDPAAYADPATTAATLVTSAAWRSDPSTRTALISQVIAEADLTREGIVALESSTINLIAQASDFPVRISSNLPIDVNVVVTLESSDRRLRFTPVEAVLEAQSVTTVTVPVQAVGSGNVSVTIQATTPDGTPVGVPAEVDVRVRADWENMGTGIIAGLFLLVLIVGVVRSARRGPRTHPVDPAEGDYDG